MINELVSFKNFVFSGNSGLSTTEIAVLFFIFCQDRKKFVFYKNVMKSALNIKDVRTLNHAIDSERIDKSCTADVQERQRLYFFNRWN